MSEWLDNQKQSNSNIRQLLKERIKKANPRRKLTTEETKRLNKLEAIAWQNSICLNDNLFIYPLYNAQS